MLNSATFVWNMPRSRSYYSRKGKKGFIWKNYTVTKIFAILPYQQLLQRSNYYSRIFLLYGAANWIFKGSNQYDPVYCAKGTNHSIIWLWNSWSYHLQQAEKNISIWRKFKIVIWNITTLKSVQAQIYSIPPKSYGLTKELAKHEIFLVPVQLARYTISPPRDIQFIKHMKYYLFLETKVSRKYEPLWYNFNFTTEGRTMQIWAPSNWKIRCPFSSEGH